MEYDNDKLRKRTPRLEMFYWVILVLLQPMTCVITIFPSKPAVWILPLLVSLLVFPAYVIYAKIVGPTLTKRWFTILMTALSFLVIQTFLLAVHSLLLKF